MGQLAVVGADWLADASKVSFAFTPKSPIGILPALSVFAAKYLRPNWFSNSISQFISVPVTWVEPGVPPKESTNSFVSHPSMKSGTRSESDPVNEAASRFIPKTSISTMFSSFALPENFSLFP